MARFLPLLAAGCRAGASYKAAVVEYSPKLAPRQNVSVEEASGYTAANWEELRGLVAEAAELGCDIVVLPEYGVVGDGVGSHGSDNEEWTRDGVSSFCEVVPDPDPNKPLCVETTDEYPGVAVLAACAAKASNVTLVVNVLEREACGHCKDGRKQFNTALVFNPRGCLVAKYRKRHLWGLERYYLDAGPKGDATFETDFGVTFGVMICFDLVFEFFPSKDVRHYVFPTDWVNAAPRDAVVETALQAQRLWSRVHGKVLLASNYGGFGKDSSGTAIWADGEALATFFNPSNDESKPQILVADVPI
ncbi:carbon-nitrogen hydrolase [Pelagophyceae sp. CCMP2097]|nr:carbon-nitrogen hydrolase [Pelagophyceae sp. CCMP2097]